MVAAAVRVLLPNKQTDGQTDRQTDICDSKVELATDSLYLIFSRKFLFLFTS